MPARHEPGFGLAPRPSPAETEVDAARLVVDAVKILHANGADSARTEARAKQISTALGTRADAHLGWTASSVVVPMAGSAAPVVWPISEAPSGLGLNRVMAVDAVADGLSTHRLTLDEARAGLSRAAALPPAGLGPFVLACAVGAGALAVILGVRHPGTVGIVAVSAALGALVRRWLGHAGLNGYWQVATAGLLAGLGGALSSALELSSPLGLAAVCPCMILVPGPHLLKGALDLASLRIDLGLARLTFALLTLAAITTGLLAGLWLGDADLLTDPPGRLVPIWIDVPAAGVAAVCYGIFYSAPLRILGWPLAVGMAAHALRWTTLNVWSAESWVGAGLACLFVGATLYPVAWRRSIPFSAIGFASVVSLMPGVLVFRALGGLVQLQDATGTHAQDLVLDTVNNLNGAALTILAMTVGLLVPAMVWHRVLLPERVPAAERGA